MKTRQNIDALITKLRDRIEPLDVETCKKTAAWLEKYVIAHDEELMREVFIKVEI